MDQQLAVRQLADREARTRVIVRRTARNPSICRGLPDPVKARKDLADRRLTRDEHIDAI
jgi:hypothetical protein